jgi:hypothetical protein
MLPNATCQRRNSEFDFGEVTPESRAKVLSISSCILNSGFTIAFFWKAISLLKPGQMFTPARLLLVMKGAFCSSKLSTPLTYFPLEWLEGLPRGDLFSISSSFRAGLPHLQRGSLSLLRVRVAAPSNSSSMTLLIIRGKRRTRTVPVGLVFFSSSHH